VVPLDAAAAQFEAEKLAEFQRPDGGYYFGRKGNTRLPYVNPVSTAFAGQALAFFKTEAQVYRHLLI
jgi:hypothetical protein